MSLSWLTRKNVKKGRVSEILLIPVSPLIVQGWEVSKNALPPKQHGHISSNAKQKTASQLMQFSSRYGPLKFVSSFFFVDVRTRICPPETLLWCLTYICNGCPPIIMKTKRKMQKFGNTFMKFSREFKNFFRLRYLSHSIFLWYS